MRAAPKLVHGVLAGLTDLCVLRLARRWLGRPAVPWAALAQLTSWFNGFCLPRTYSNGVEALLLVAALALWDDPVASLAGRAPAGGGAASGTRGAFAGALLASLSVLVRPPALIPWGFLGAAVLLRGPPGATSRAMRAAPPALITALALSACADRWLYGRWTAPLVEFVRFNVLTGSSAQYGTHHPLWYFAEGAGAVLASLLVPIGWLVWAARRSGARGEASGKEREGAQAARGAAALASVGLSSLAGLSAVGHKEFRFMLPALQLLVPAAGAGLAAMWGGGRPGRWAVRAVVAVQAAMLLFFGFVHQRGGTAALEHLSRAPGGGGGAYVLMPCHATPFHAYVHSPEMPLGFPDCSPPAWRPEGVFTFPAGAPLTMAEWAAAGGGGDDGAAGGASEESLVLGEPGQFLRALEARGALPQRLVVYDTLLSRLSGGDGGVLGGMGYAEEARFFHSPLPSDHGDVRWVVVLARRGSGPGGREP